MTPGGRPKGADATVVVLMCDTRVAGVPVAECGEPLVEVGEDVLVDARKAAVNPGRALVRAGLAHRLREAQARLPDGLRLLLVEGYRPAARQELYFRTYRDRLRAADPLVSDAELLALTSRFVSPPAIAPHVSGAAVDLTLAGEDGAELDLGTPVDATPEESDGRCYFAARVPDAARHHRTVLAEALGGAGLVNYPTEWWHWSYGDRYWAFATRAAAARYGPVPTGRTPSR